MEFFLQRTSRGTRASFQVDSECSMARNARDLDSQEELRGAQVSGLSLVDARATLDSHTAWPKSEKTWLLKPSVL